MPFSRQPCPVWFLPDLEGNILDDTYYAFFLSPQFPYLFQEVYKYVDGTFPWNNPIQFYPNGTLPDNIYFDDGKTYRVEIRRGDTMADQLIYEFENIGSEDILPPTPVVSLPVDNQITNPQFTEISFFDTMTIDNTGTNSYEIAPGWFIEASGTGVITIERDELAGDQNIPEDTPTNPGYVLKITITSGTFTVVNLVQRFSNISGLWADTGLSINFTARMSVNSATLEVFYRPSAGTPATQTLFSETITSVYAVYANAVEIINPENPDLGDDAYVDIVFKLPVSGTIFLTNIQLISSTTAVIFPFGQTSAERQKDHMFHYYSDSLLRQQKDNILVGWTFGLNPWQFHDVAGANLANNAYTADQTIIVQQKYVLDATGNNVFVGRGSVAENYALKVMAVTANNRFAMIQYIHSSTARPYWGQVLSAMVRAYLVNGDACRFKVRLIYRSSIPPQISQNEPITTWTADGDPNLATGWSAVTPENDPIYSFTTEPQNFAFDKFILPASDNADMTLGFMLYTVDALDETPSADYLLFDRISLVQNDFAIDASAETFEQVLSQCQYYYETSYSTGALLATAAASLPNAILAEQRVIKSGGNGQSYRTGFNVTYNTIKCRVPPNPISFYNPNAGGINLVYAELTDGATFQTSASVAIGTYVQKTSGTRGFSYIGADASVLLTAAIASDLPESFILFHYAADSRLGI